MNTRFAILRLFYGLSFIACLYSHAARAEQSSACTVSVSYITRDSVVLRFNELPDIVPGPNPKKKFNLVVTTEEGTTQSFVFTDVPRVQYDTYVSYKVGGGTIFRHFSDITSASIETSSDTASSTKPCTLSIPPRMSMNYSFKMRLAEFANLGEGSTDCRLEIRNSVNNSLLRSCPFTANGQVCTYSDTWDLWELYMLDQFGVNSNSRFTVIPICDGADIRFERWLLDAPGGVDNQYNHTNAYFREIPENILRATYFDVYDKLSAPVGEINFIAEFGNPALRDDANKIVVHIEPAVYAVSAAWTLWNLDNIDGTPFALCPAYSSPCTISVPNNIMQMSRPPILEELLIVLKPIATLPYTQIMVQPGDCGEKVFDSSAAVCWMTNGSLSTRDVRIKKHVFFKIIPPARLTVQMMGVGSVTAPLVSYFPHYPPAPAINCGLGGNACSSQYTGGTSIQVKATPGPNATFVKWSGTAAPTGAAALVPTATVIMDHDKSLTAEFFMLPFP